MALRTLHIFILLLFIVFFALPEKLYAKTPSLTSLIPGLNHINLTFTSDDYEEDLRLTLQKSLRQNRLEKDSLEITPTLGKQVQLEKDLLKKLLRSEGFYDATVTSVMPENIKSPTLDDVVYTINPRTPTTLSSATIESDLPQLPTLKMLGLKPGMRFRASKLLAAQQKLKKQIDTQYCLWNIDVSYKAFMQPSQQEASISFIVSPSEPTTFSTPSLEGVTSIDPNFLLNQIGIKDGDCFKQSTLEKAKVRLLKTGLIASIETTLTKKETIVHPTFTIIERKHRTVKIGGGINSDEGISISTGWEHRNIFGKGQKLQANATLSQYLRQADTSLTIPSFFSKKNSLVLSASGAQENLEAYNADSLTSSISLKHLFSKHITGIVGSDLEVEYIEDAASNETFGLLSFPTSLMYDSRDNILDTKKGWFANITFAPFIDTFNSNTVFTKGSISASTYHSFEKLYFSPTLALRGATGIIEGLNTDDIPANKRFYTGGSGSVRGYPFQKLGPVTDSVPTGGRSFIETSLETRLHFSESWGSVFFIDGGNTYSNDVPDFNDDLRWAYGTGLRYYTSFAPIRLDVAFPIERRKGIDNLFQFYISIGQAF